MVLPETFHPLAFPSGVLDALTLGCRSQVRVAFSLLFTYRSHRPPHPFARPFHWGPVPGSFGLDLSNPRFPSSGSFSRFAQLKFGMTPICSVCPFRLFFSDSWLAVFCFFGLQLVHTGLSRVLTACVLWRIPAWSVISFPPLSGLLRVGGDPCCLLCKAGHVVTLLRRWFGRGYSLVFG